MAGTSFRVDVSPDDDVAKLRGGPCSYLAARDDGTVTEAPRLEFRLLGRFAVLRDGAEIPTGDFGGRKVRTLLRILATRRGSFVSNDALTEMLWPDRHPADPAANLQVLVTRARKALGDPAIIQTGHGGYALAGGTSCQVDAEQFLAAVATDGATSSLATLGAALAQWAGEPLAEDVYADWAVDFRSRVLRTRQDALERAAGLAIDADRLTEAVDFASAAADAEPLREAAVLALVRALVAAGDPAAALVRYDEYRRALADELGVDPSAEAAALHQQLLRGTAGAAAAPLRRVPVDFTELPFVGRDSDLRRIRTIFAVEATGRRGATVSVAGESGSGKSRLIANLGIGVPTIVARAVAPESAEPWSLMRTLLREILAEDITYRDALPSSLATALASLLPELGGDATTADPQSLRALVQEAASRILGAADRIIVVDDLQWADPTSLAVIETAVARLPDLRLLLAYRPEDIPHGGDVSIFLDGVHADLRLHLGGLTGAAISQLVGDEELASALAAHTDRAPLAVSEVLRALAGEAMVVRGPDGRWRGADPGAVARAVELGRQGKKHAIAARAARQEPGARRVLELICLIAREVSVATLATASEADETDVLDELGALFRAGLVRLGESGWATAHDMVNETLVEGLGSAARAQLHARLAVALEAESGDPAELARHRLAAGDAGRAADAFVRAAEEALAGFADQEAVSLADSGLAANPAPRVVGALHEARAQARARLGDIPGARDDLRAALSRHEHGPDRARLLGRLATLASGSDDLVRAAELAELALVEAGSDRAARAEALEVASVLDMNLDRTERAAERSAAALELYRQLGDATGTARILDARAMATFLDGDVRGGVTALRQVADLFEDSGDLVRVVTPRSTSGHASVFAGRADEGLAATAAALDLARTLGHPEGQAYALWHRAEALAALGRPGEALADADEALAIATRLGHRGWTATSWRAVGIARQTAGDLPQALDAYLRSLDASEHLGLFASWAAARAALVLVTMGDLDRALPLATRSLDEGPPLGHYEARLAQAELAAATDDPRAVDLAREALAQADSGGVRQHRERLVQLAAG
jgi:DNA-binding SARP family transcriptional activator